MFTLFTAKSLFTLVILPVIVAVMAMVLFFLLIYDKDNRRRNHSIFMKNLKDDCLCSWEKVPHKQKPKPVIKAEKPKNLTRRE